MLCISTCFFFFFPEKYSFFSSGLKIRVVFRKRKVHVRGDGVAKIINYQTITCLTKNKPKSIRPKIFVGYNYWIVVKKKKSNTISTYMCLLFRQNYLILKFLSDICEKNLEKLLKKKRLIFNFFILFFYYRPVLQ